MYCFIQDYLVNIRIKMINLNARKPHENMLACACSFLRGWIVSSWSQVHPSSWAQIAVDQTMMRRHHPPCESRSICTLALLSAMEIKGGDLDLTELQKDVCSSTKSNPLCGTKPKRSFWYRFLLPCPSPAKGNPLFFAWWESLIWPLYLFKFPSSISRNNSTEVMVVPGLLVSSWSNHQ